MKIIIEFATDNASFEDGNDSPEAIVRRIADRLANGHGNIRDTNGNHIGRWEVTDDNDDEE